MFVEFVGKIWVCVAPGDKVLLLNFRTSLHFSLKTLAKVAYLGG